MLIFSFLSSFSMPGLVDGALEGCDVAIVDGALVGCEFGAGGVGMLDEVSCKKTNSARIVFKDDLRKKVLFKECMQNLSRSARRILGLAEENPGNASAATVTTRAFVWGASAARWSE